MPTSDDRFDKLENLIESRYKEMRTQFREDMRAGFGVMRTELKEDMRAELKEDMQAGFQDMRSELRAELASEIRTAIRAEIAPGFAAVNKRIDGLSTQFVEFRRDFVGRVDALANYVHLTDQGYLKMSDRLFNLEQRVDRIESAGLFQ